MAKKDLETPTCSITRVKIDDFLNSDVKDFARYCIENRACPRLSDGQRTGAPERYRNHEFFQKRHYR